MNISEGEPFLIQILLLCILPFAAYYLGVFIRKRVFPSENSPPLGLAIPLSILVISPLLVTIGPALNSANSVVGYMVTIGVIIEHGIFMNEAVAERFAKRQGGGG